MSERPIVGLRPLPPELPAAIEDWERFGKESKTLNDWVEEAHRKLVKNPRYRAFLRACWDEQAVEGSLAADNTMSAQMIRDHAITEADENNPLCALDHDGQPKEKLATISKSLGVVLRRYHASRKERRQKVGGEIVPDGNHDSRD